MAPRRRSEETGRDRSLVERRVVVTPWLRRGYSVETSARLRYARGFDDAKKGRTFNSHAAPDYGPPPPRGYTGGSGFGLASLSKVVSLGFFGKQIYDLGGGPNWTFDACQRNFMAQPPYDAALKSSLSERSCFGRRRLHETTS